MHDSMIGLRERPMLLRLVFAAVAVLSGGSAVAQPARVAGPPACRELEQKLERLLGQRLQVQAFDPRVSTSCALATSTASFTGFTR